MLTGFNTDIEHAGVVYHVQTEDKGVDTPLILTLVYSGGVILASKRSPYDDLVAAGFEESALAERVNRQHKLICAAVLAGRIADLQKMTEREATSRNASKAEPRRRASDRVEDDLPPRTNDPGRRVSDSVSKAIEPPVVTPVSVIPIEILDAEILQPSSPFGEFPLADAYEVVAEFARAESIEHSPIRIKLMDDQDLHGGERVALRVMVLRGADGNDVIAGAEVTVKVLGSTFKPLVFQSKTGPNGVATLRMQLPHFNTGRAAILARANAEGHEAELRRIVRQG